MELIQRESRKKKSLIDDFDRAIREISNRNHTLSNILDQAFQEGLLSEEERKKRVQITPPITPPIHVISNEKLQMRKSDEDFKKDEQTSPEERKELGKKTKLTPPITVISNEKFQMRKSEDDLPNFSKSPITSPIISPPRNSPNNVLSSPKYVPTLISPYLAQDKKVVDNPTKRTLFPQNSIISPIPQHRSTLPQKEN